VNKKTTPSLAGKGKKGIGHLEPINLRKNIPASKSVTYLPELK
jgi:hypothetical protein